jgi:hypothetical protein
LLALALVLGSRGSKVVKLNSSYVERIVIFFEKLAFNPGTSFQLMS